MKKMKKIMHITLISLCISLLAISIMIMSPTVFAADPSNVATATVSVYNAESKTPLPKYDQGSEEDDSTYKDYDGTLGSDKKTTITICKWDEWEWDSSTNKFVKKHYETDPTEFIKPKEESGTISTWVKSDFKASILYAPENEKGLKEFVTEEIGEKTKTGWKTRSGYGFSVVNYFNFQNIKTTNPANNVRASLTFPEFNYSKDNGKFNDMTIRGTYQDPVTKKFACSFELGENLKEDGTTDGEQIHYTPMWFGSNNKTESEEYMPILEVRGLWSPIAEVQYDIKQTDIGELNEKNKTKVETNSYMIQGSLFDDMYTQHDQFTSTTETNIKEKK